MSNLIAIGQVYDKMASVSSFAFSPDGYAWTTSNSVSQPFLPFLPRLSGIGISWIKDLPWAIRSNGIFPTLKGITWGNYQFIAVGLNGTIVSSTDGIHWNQVTSGVTQDLNGILYNGAIYIIVGDAGLILTSLDGSTWTIMSSGTSVQLYSVAWSSDLSLFVAVGANGTIISSSDSVIWSIQVSNTTTKLNSIANIPTVWDVGGWDPILPLWYYSYFVIVGDAGIVLTSTNGTTWTAQNSNVTTTLNGVCWDGYGVIAVGINGISISSNDSITWKIDATGITDDLNALCSGQYRDIEVGGNGTILRTDTITSLSQDTVQVDSMLYGVAYSLYLNLFVAVGQSGLIMSNPFEYPTQTFTAISDSGYVSSSFDGNVWSPGSIIQANFSPRAIYQAVDASGLNSVVMVVGTQKYATTEPSHNQFDEVGQIFVSSMALGTIGVDDPGFEDSWVMVYAEDSTASVYNGVRQITPPPVTIIANPLSNVTVSDTITISIDGNNAFTGLVDLLSAGSIPNVGTVSFSNNPNTTYELINVTITNETWIFQFAGIATFTISDLATFIYTHPRVWVVCGVSYNNPVLLYSLNDGLDWAIIEIPTLFNNIALFDITYTNAQFYISGYGVILYTYSLINPTWNATNFVTSPYGEPNFVKIASNPSGHVVASASGLLYYTLDGAAWKSYYQPGYQFTSIVWYIDHWVAGVSSLLTTYTYFTSTDSSTWTGHNNTVQMYDFYITS